MSSCFIYTLLIGHRDHMVSLIRSTCFPSCCANRDLLRIWVALMLAPVLPSIDFSMSRRANQSPPPHLGYRQNLTIHTQPEFPRNLNMHNSRIFLHVYILPKFNLRILPLQVLHVLPAESQRLPIMKQTSLIEILEIRALGGSPKSWKSQPVQLGGTPNKPRKCQTTYIQILPVWHTGIICVTIAVPMVKAPYWALVPPDQIGKEALAYSKLLGQKSYTINSGKLLNMHVGRRLCTIIFLGK